MADVNITITILNANVSRVRAALLDKYPNPEKGYTDVQWFKVIIAKFLRKIVLEYEERKAVDVATLEASVKIDTAKTSVIVPDNITI